LELLARSAAFLPCGRKYRAAGTLPGRQQSTGLLHFIIRIWLLSKKEDPSKRMGLLFWSC